MTFVRGKGDMQVKIIDPSKDKRWDEFVGNHPKGSVFHLSAWAKVIQKTYNYIPCYFILEESDKKIRAGCPFFLIKSWLTGNRLVCLPFTDNCFPLVTSDENIEPLLSTAIEKAKKEKADYIEERGEYPSVFLPSLHFENHSYYKLFKLDLSQGINSLWKGFKQKSICYPIKKAEKANLEIENSETEKGMRDFYFLNLATRKKHGVLPQPYDFFKNIWEELVLNKLAFLLLVKYEETPIAGSIFFVYKDTIYYKFNASDRNYLEYHPNHLLLWHAIQYSCQNGFRYFDFGRTSPDNSGLMSFKRHWGTEELDLPYYYWPTVKGVVSTEQKSLKYRIITSVLRRMPTSFSRATGELLYKHLG